MIMTSDEIPKSASPQIGKPNREIANFTVNWLANVQLILDSRFGRPLL